MSRATNRITAFLPLVLLLGAAAPAQAGDQDLPTQMDFLSRLRAAPGEEGVGLGALVLPTTAEIGQLSLTLYNASDRPRYWMAGSLSLYLPATSFGGLPHGYQQFGGFNGSLREVPQDTGVDHPAFVGFVRGSWTMEPSGHGMLHCIVYRVDGEGLWIPMGLVRGEFDATEIASNAVDGGGFPAGVASSAAAGAANQRPSRNDGAGNGGGQSSAGSLGSWDLEPQGVGEPQVSFGASATGAAHQRPSRNTGATNEGGQSSAGSNGSWDLEPQGLGEPQVSFGASATGAANLRPSRRGVIGPCLGPQTGQSSATGVAGSAWLAPRGSGEIESSYSYAELSFVREAQGPTVLGRELRSQAARLADMASIGLFPRATDESGLEFESAGAQAGASISNDSGVLGEPPTQVHMEAHVLASFKLVR